MLLPKIINSKLYQKQIFLDLGIYGYLIMMGYILYKIDDENNEEIAKEDIAIIQKVKIIFHNLSCIEHH